MKVVAYDFISKLLGSSPYCSGLVSTINFPHMVGNKKKYIEFQPKMILLEDLDVWSNDSVERSGPNLISCENQTLLLSERSKFGGMGLSLLLTYGGQTKYPRPQYFW